VKKITEKTYQARINQILLYIQQHLDEDISLDRLADLACFSSYHFHRIFRGIVGESIKEYIRRLKLERAVWQLRSTKQSILQIALQAGFETHASFIRAFQKMFRKTPSQVRLLKKGALFNPKEISHIKPIGELIMNVTIKTIEPIKVAYMRHIGPYQEATTTWDKLKTWAQQHKLDFTNKLFIGVGYDDPEVTPAAKLRYDACISVADNIKADGEVGIQVLPGGEYATVTHQGPYYELAEVYAWLIGTWLPQSGRDADNVSCFEIYLNAPEHTKPENLLTEIYLALT